MRSCSAKPFGLDESSPDMSAGVFRARAVGGLGGLGAKRGDVVGAAAPASKRPRYQFP
jgi:hypothetical protein